MKDLSLHLMDLLQNSIVAGADLIEITIAASARQDLLVIRIVDNGCGMEPELAERVDNPFVTTRDTRKVGLGIPLFKASANLAGGDLKIDSKPGRGTTVEATFRISHIDRLPLGDIAETITSMIAAHPEADMLIKLDNEKESFVLDTAGIKATLGEVPVTEYEVLCWLKDYLNEGVKKIFGGVLNEIAG